MGHLKSFYTLDFELFDLDPSVMVKSVARDALQRAYIAELVNVSTFDENVCVPPIAIETGIDTSQMLRVGPIFRCLVELVQM